MPLYFNDIITRDIVRRRNVKHVAALIRLGEILCRENTRLFNWARTATLLNIKDNLTFAKYCDYFKACFLFYEIRKFSRPLRQQLRV